MCVSMLQCAMSVSKFIIISVGMSSNLIFSHVTFEQYVSTASTPNALVV